jgi:DNA-binding transcriptional LysR family regulator
MNKIQSRNFDANLVRVFLSIWETRSLTTSAERLNLTQSAISHALKRLRDRFRDPLFVRTPGGMTPTDIAGRLFGPFNEAHHILERVVQEAGAFDPGSSNRLFRLAMSDVAESIFFPSLVKLCALNAPNVRLEIVPLHIGEISRLLKLGEVDMAVGYLPGLTSDFISQELFHDDLTCLLGDRHPPLPSPFSPADFAGLKHIDAGLNAPGHKMVDDLLEKMALKRNIFVKTTRLYNALPMLEGTDLALIFPNVLIDEFYKTRKLIEMKIPFDLMPVKICTHHHANYQNDPSILWVKNSIKQISRRRGRIVRA